MKLTDGKLYFELDDQLGPWEIRHSNGRVLAWCLFWLILSALALALWVSFWTGLDQLSMRSELRTVGTAIQWILGAAVCLRIVLFVGVLIAGGERFIRSDGKELEQFFPFGHCVGKSFNWKVDLSEIDFIEVSASGKMYVSLKSDDQLQKYEHVIENTRWGLGLTKISKLFAS